MSLLNYYVYLSLLDMAGQTHNKALKLTDIRRCISESALLLSLFSYFLHSLSTNREEEL